MLDFNYINLTLYNKQELLSKLSLKKMINDESFIEEMYNIFGESLFEKLNGDFAFSFYDKTQDILYATRDALGVKALYYVMVKEKYYFSDDIDSLFEKSKIDKKPNLKSMRTLLYQTTIEYEDTMYEDIKRVPPGHYLKVEGKDIKLIRYWYPEKIKTNYNITLNEVSTQFKTLFQQAIENRIETDEDTAYELSGGLDSSSIVSLLKKEYPEKKIDTYTMSFKGLNCDESAYVNAVEKQYQFKTEKIASEKIDYQHAFDFKFNYQMNPHWPIITTFTMIFPMLQCMKKVGKKVVITGQGGDHLLTGSCRVLADLFKRKAFKKLIREIKSGGYTLIQVIGCGIVPLLHGKTKSIVKKILFPFFKTKSKKVKIADLFHLDNHGDTFKIDDMRALLSSNHSLIMDGNALHTLEKTYNVEFRHPFFDKHLVEFIFSLPPEYRYSQGWIKILLRYAMEDILADEIRSRHDKAEFSSVIIQQLDAIDVKKVLQNASLVSLGLIEQKEIARVLKLFEKKNYDELLFLWRLVNLEYWYTQQTYE